MGPKTRGQRERHRDIQKVTEKETETEEEKESDRVGQIRERKKGEKR